MRENNRPKLEDCMELVKSLEHQNEIQDRLIHVQSGLIKSLEEHNAEMEKIISELTRV